MTDAQTFKLMRLGSAGSRVRAITAALRNRGYATGRVSSMNYTHALAREVKRFQAQNFEPDGTPLAVDGVVGPKTWAALHAADAPRSDGSVWSQVRQHLRDPHVAQELVRAGLHHHEIGVRERPMGSNKVDVIEKRAQGKPWCDFWVHDRIRHVTGKWLFGGRRGSTRVSLRLAIDAGMEVYRPPQPGDIFTLCDKTGRAYHTGIVILRSPHATYYTVEGNCANRVAVRERPIDGTTVWWSPFKHNVTTPPAVLPNIKRIGEESTR